MQANGMTFRVVVFLQQSIYVKELSIGTQADTFWEGTPRSAPKASIIVIWYYTFWEGSASTQMHPYGVLFIIYTSFATRPQDQDSGIHIHPRSYCITTLKSHY